MPCNCSRLPICRLCATLPGLSATICCLALALRSSPSERLDSRVLGPLERQGQDAGHTNIPEVKFDCTSVNIKSGA